MLVFGTQQKNGKIVCATCKKEVEAQGSGLNFCSRCGNPLTKKGLELRADEYTEQRTKLIMDIVEEMKEGCDCNEIIRDYYKSIKDVK